MFLGLKNISIKSHGNADEIGFANAMKVASNLVENNLNKKIIEELNITNYKNK